VLKELYEEYSKKDPVELFEGVLVDAGVLDVDAAKQVRADARQLAIAARRKALADPMPDPSDIEDGVYAD
jgi:pyruvate dehydrogenase E1 component alpha subunit